MKLPLNLHLARRQRGLTLIELVVVMAILIILAAIILGNFPDLIKRATTSTSASNLSDLTRIVQIESSLNQQFPNGYDSLHSDGTTLSSRLPANSATVLTSSVLTAPEVTLLTAAGVTSVYNHSTVAASDATFAATTSSPVVPVAIAQQFAKVNAAALTANNIVFAGNVYALGLGSRLSIVGPGNRLQDAPLYTAQNVKPSSNYSRPVALFGVSTTEVKFLGAFGIDGGQLRSLTTRMQDYNSATP